MNGTSPEGGTRTTLRTAAAPASGPGRLGRAGTWGHTLPEGTRLGEFEIVGLVGEGGFGIVYLAFDHSLQRQVALKEYMPSALASRRTGDRTVAVKSDHHIEAFQAGMASFINEARLLAQFDNPALVKVYRFWEANGTAYMVMPFYEGPTLEKALQALGHPPDEAWLRQVLDPVLSALGVLHDARCLHRDIAPDNILITATGPILLDFGAARRVIGDATQSLTAMLKVGYAPVEQYGQIESMRQGPWTDIYALSSVAYYAITGKPPMASLDRLIQDRLRPLSEQAGTRYSATFLRAIDAGLAVAPEARPRSCAEFRALLDGESPHAPESEATDRETPATLPWPPKQTSSTQDRTHHASRPVTRGAGAHVGRRTLPVAGIAAAVLVLGGAVAWWTVSHRGSPAVTSPVAPSPASIASASPVSSPVPAATAPQSVTVSAPASAPAIPTPRTDRPRDHTRVAHDAPAANSPERNYKQATRRCDDLLQKASIEPLSGEDLAYWKKECS
jgi:serine/threonine protein kinase